MSITLLLLLLLLPLFHERAILVGGAEIHIDAFDPVAYKAEKLRIVKTLAAFCLAFVGHKGLIASTKIFSSSCRSIQSLLRRQRSK
jgi:hypothetical protein